MENKYVKPLPPVVTPEKYLSVHQATWLRQRHAEGRSVGVLIGSSDGHLFFPGLSWETSVSREQWIQSGKTTKEIAEELIEMLGEVGCNLYNSPHETEHSS